MERLRIAMNEHEQWKLCEAAEQYLDKELCVPSTIHPPGPFVLLVLPLARGVFWACLKINMKAAFSSLEVKGCIASQNIFKGVLCSEPCWSKHLSQGLLSQNGSQLRRELFNNGKGWVPKTTLQLYSIVFKQKGRIQPEMAKYY